MISSFTRQTLQDAIQSPKKFASGAERRKLQATYDKMLNELSESILDRPCSSRMQMRQQLNSIKVKTPQIEALLDLMRNEDLLFSKDYRDHSLDIVKFLTNHLTHFLEAI